MAGLRWRVGDADRGQLLLVGAFGMAVVLVVLAMLLNTAIHAGTLATQGTDATIDREVAEFRFEAAGAARRAVVAANRRDDATYADRHAILEAAVDDWSDLAARHATTGGVGTNVTVRPHDGTRVVQTNATRTMTNRAGEGSWILVAGTDATRGFRLNVSRSSLVDTSDENVTLESAFRVVVDGTGRWRAFLHRNGSGEVLVTVEDGVGNRLPTCAAAPTNGYVVVDVSNASVGERDCPPLDFFDDADGPYDVGYVRGRNATGSYTLVANRTADVVDDGDFGADGDSSAPFATPAVYAATVTVAYATPRLTYETDVSVVPGDDGA